MPPLGSQILTLCLLALPIATLTWTLTHEEITREFRTACTRRSRASQGMLARKFFYVFTCEYCFSHWVALLFLAITGFKLIYADWRGLLVAGFSLIWIANLYMGLYRPPPSGHRGGTTGNQKPGDGTPLASQIARSAIERVTHGRLSYTRLTKSRYLLILRSCDANKASSCRLKSPSVPPPPSSVNAAPMNFTAT